MMSSLDRIGSHGYAVSFCFGLLWCYFGYHFAYKDGKINTLYVEIVKGLNM
jgi:hypothetical protein